MLNLSDLEKAGVMVKKFCGLDIQDGVGCTEEAVGDITLELEGDKHVSIPVCQQHIDLIKSEFDVENVG